MIGLRDGRLNQRCDGCHKKSKMQDWCDRYNENRNYCIITCILDHKVCQRDHPIVKEQVTRWKKKQKDLGADLKMHVDRYAATGVRCMDVMIEFGLSNREFTRLIRYGELPAGGD